MAYPEPRLMYSSHSSQGPCVTCAAAPCSVLRSAKLSFLFHVNGQVDEALFKITEALLNRECGEVKLRKRTRKRTAVLARVVRSL